jgi:hypothetical protein
MKFLINKVNLKSLRPLIVLECSIEANSVVPLFCSNLKNANIRSNFQRAVKTEREPIWGENKKYVLLYLFIDAVYQISLTSEMVGWTPLDDLTWNDSDLNLRHCLTSVVVCRLRVLSEHCSVYSPLDNELRNGNEWVRNTFNKHIVMGTSMTPM